MPAIPATDAKGFGTITLTETTLDGSDSFVYKARDILMLRNATGGALSPVIDGDGGSSVNNEGLANVDVSGGFPVGSIAPAAHKLIRLDSIKAYLSGTIAINSGTGLVATLITPK